jgi:hypothetical protein
VTQGLGLPERFVRREEARAEFGDRAERLGGYLWRSDPVADIAVEGIAECKEPSHSLIGRALKREEKGIPVALISLVQEASEVPPWVDWDRIERAGRFFLRAGVLGGMVLGARSLVLSYASPGGNKPLVFSGRLREAAGPRLHETARFVSSVVRPGTMRPGGEGWQITLRVRLMHAQVRRMLRAAPAWQDQRWGVPINQHDMLAASLVFSVVVIDGVRLLGLAVDRDEADDFLHLWRWVSQVIGVDPALLPTTEAEAKRLGALIALTQGPPDDDSRALTRALLESGLSHPNPAERERARRVKGLGEALCRHLVGPALADQLEIARTKERFVLPAAIRTVRALEVARRHSGTLENALVRAGERYWDQVLQKGLIYATVDFKLPEHLRHPLSRSTI